MSGKINLPHVCPNCKKTTANTYQELEDLFGFRNMNEKNKTSVRNQSWCRKCRAKSTAKEKE